MLLPGNALRKKSLIFASIALEFFVKIKGNLEKPRSREKLTTDDCSDSRYKCFDSRSRKINMFSCGSLLQVCKVYAYIGFTYVLMIHNVPHTCTENCVEYDHRILCSAVASPLS
jgi:hypothetical protein